MSSPLQNLSFSKYEGLGNDFILIDDRLLTFPFKERHWIQRLCHRKLGVGADGLILVQSDPKYDFRMRIFNADGSEAESCGNGLRCFFRFLEEIGTQAQTYGVRMHRRLIMGRVQGEEVFVNMGRAMHLRLDLKVGDERVHFVNTGVPHIVAFVDHLQEVDVAKRGALLRHHPLFSPKGANVNFVEKKNDARFCVRTFERGVEGETLACGTGAVAVSAVAQALANRRNHLREMEIVFSEGSLKIQKEQGCFWMSGPARHIYSGTWTASQ